jgi:uncharacterized sporulation protein YeaH/YhbH (DUF444 family)
MLYRVYVPLRGCNEYTVDADSVEEAIESVADGNGIFQSHDALNENTDTGTWDAEPDSN